MTTEKPFNSNRGSSSIMEAELTPAMVEKFMKTSFYLPIDVLKNQDWVVGSIYWMSGEKFHAHASEGDSIIYCVEDFALLSDAQWVGLSTRLHKPTNIKYTVAKLWYGPVPTQRPRSK